MVGDSMAPANLGRWRERYRVRVAHAGYIFVSSDDMENIVAFPRGTLSGTVSTGTSAQGPVGVTLKFPFLSNGGGFSTATASAGGVTAMAAPREPPPALTLVQAPSPTLLWAASLAAIHRAGSIPRHKNRRRLLSPRHKLQKLHRSPFKVCETDSAIPV